MAVLIVFLIFFTPLFVMAWNGASYFSAMIALIVAMIPEGLPAVLTMILSMGVR